MKTIFNYLCLSLMFISISAFADTKSDEIIQANIKAMGGKEKFEKVKTTSFDAQISLVEQNMDMKISFWLKKPEMMRIITEYISMGMKVEAGTDGTTFWGTAPGTTTKMPIPDQALSQIKMQFASLQELLIPTTININYEGQNVTFKGTKVIDEKTCNVIEITNGTDDTKTEIYFDAITNFIYASKIKGEYEGTEFDAETKIKQYQKVDGILCPKEIEVYNDNMLQQKMTITNVVFNNEMNDSDFKMN